MTCYYVVSIGKAFDLVTEPEEVTSLVVTASAVVGSYYFCDWLEEQF